MASKGWTRGQILGRGSTATVSIATANASGELFAVKSAELARSSFLQRELGFLSSLDCDNVVSCLGHDMSDGMYDLFLEYAPGGTLSDYVTKCGGSLLEADIRLRTREVLTGLALLHSRKIVHCDIKSQNILIGSAGQAMIADLGCAKSTCEAGMQLRGTPMFMAPEVARGDCQGTAADIWAVGCVAIEMATGRSPWPETSDAIAVLHRIAFSADVPEVPRWMSEEGKDFLNRCLRRDAEERWTADQLLRHPFLLNCANSGSERTRSSPKSILDQSIWESLEEETDTDTDDQVPSVEQPQRMITELVGGGSSGPNWTWDENWLTVRTDDDNDKEEQDSVQEEEECQEIVNDDLAVILASTASEDTVMITNSTIASSSQDFAVQAHRTDTDTDHPSVLDNCESGDDRFHIANPVTNFHILDYALSMNNCNYVNSDHHYFTSNGNKNLLIAILKTFHRIFALIPVVTPPLSFSLCCVVSCALWLDQQKDHLIPQANYINKITDRQQKKNYAIKRVWVSNHVSLAHQYNMCNLELGWPNHMYCSHLGYIYIYIYV